MPESHIIIPLNNCTSLMSHHFPDFFKIRKKRRKRTIRASWDLAKDRRSKKARRSPQASHCQTVRDANQEERKQRNTQKLNIRCQTWSAKAYGAWNHRPRPAEATGARARHARDQRLGKRKPPHNHWRTPPPDPPFKLPKSTCIMLYSNYSRCTMRHAKRMRWKSRWSEPRSEK